MSFTVCLFLQLLFSAFWSNAQTTSSDRDKGEDYVSNLEYIWQSLRKNNQNLEHQSWSPDGPKTASHRDDCEDRNSNCSDILLSLEKTNRLIESLSNQNRSAAGPKSAVHRRNVDDINCIGIQPALENTNRLLEVLTYQNQLGVGNLCPSGFNRRARSVDKCYAVVTQPMSWDAAQEKCRALDPKAHLVVINSPLENQIINDILDDYNCNGSEEGNWFWTSGRRQILNDCSSRFVWKTNSRNNQAVLYSNFCPGEPNCRTKEENCLTLAKDCHSEESISGWQNDICSYLFCPICEFLKLVET